MTDTQELAYKRKAKLRKKHRKVRVELVSDMTNIKIANMDIHGYPPSYMNYFLDLSK